MTRERSFWFGKTFDAGAKRRAETERGIASERAVPPESVSGLGTEALLPRSASRPPDPRVFQTGRSEGVDPIRLARLIARAETLAECHRIASALERGQANAAAVRIRLGALVEDAWLQVEAIREGAPLEETPPQSGRATGVSSSGAEPTLSPSAPLPLTYELWLSAITHAYDEILRALGFPEPESRGVDAKPKLRVVE